MAGDEVAAAIRLDVAKKQRDRALDVEAEALVQAKTIAHKLHAANRLIEQLKAENAELAAKLAGRRKKPAKAKAQA